MMKKLLVKPNSEKGQRSEDKLYRNKIVNKLNIHFFKKKNTVLEHTVPIVKWLPLSCRKLILKNMIHKK